VTAVPRRFRRLWMWSQDGAPSWFAAYIGEYMWRPWCWLRGYHVPHHCDVYFECCVLCTALIWSKGRDGTPNPCFRHADGTLVARSPAGWRRQNAIAADWQTVP